jgi:hypothetical protein
MNLKNSSSRIRFFPTPPRLRRAGGRKLIAIGCLTILMMSSALQAMNPPLRSFDNGPYRRLSLNDQLLFAAEKGDKQQVEALLCKRINVNARDINGETVLHLAVKNNHKAICELLVSHGADVNKVNKFGWTALRMACDIEMYKFLIEKGTNVNVQSSQLRTILMDAASHGKDEICGLLLANGARIDMADKGGRTALKWAVSCGQYKTCKSLIRMIVKPPKKQLDSMVALLGSIKRRSTAQPLRVGRDVVALLGRAGQAEINEIKRINKIEAEKEINKIDESTEDESAEKAKLLNYLEAL